MGSAALSWERGAQFVQKSDSAGQRGAPREEAVCAVKWEVCVWVVLLPPPALWCDGLSFPREDNVPSWLRAVLTQSVGTADKHSGFSRLCQRDSPDWLPSWESWSVFTCNFLGQFWVFLSFLIGNFLVKHYSFCFVSFHLWASSNPDFILIFIRIKIIGILRKVKSFPRFKIAFRSSCF